MDVYSIGGKKVLFHLYKKSRRDNCTLCVALSRTASTGLANENWRKTALRHFYPKRFPCRWQTFFDWMPVISFPSSLLFLPLRFLETHGISCSTNGFTFYNTKISLIYHRIASARDIWSRGSHRKFPRGICNFGADCNASLDYFQLQAYITTILTLFFVFFSFYCFAKVALMPRGK